MGFDARSTAAAGLVASQGSLRRSAAAQDRVVPVVARAVRLSFAPVARSVAPAVVNV